MSAGRCSAVCLCVHPLAARGTAVPFWHREPTVLINMLPDSPRLRYPAGVGPWEPSSLVSDPFDQEHNGGASGRPHNSQTRHLRRQSRGMVRAFLAREVCGGWRLVSVPTVNIQYMVRGIPGFGNKIQLTKVSSLDGKRLGNTPFRPEACVVKLLDE